MKCEFYILGKINIYKLVIWGIYLGSSRISRTLHLRPVISPEKSGLISVMYPRICVGVYCYTSSASLR
jgi:hypothetical protein